MNRLTRSLSLLALGVAAASSLHAQSTTSRAISSCTSILCIDAPPSPVSGNDGSGGFGYDPVAKAAVSALHEKKAYPFTVTVMQDASLPFCGSASPLVVTLTYSTRDFTVTTTDGSGVTGTAPFDRGGVLTFSYGGSALCHTDQSFSYTFTPVHTITTAVVAATVTATSTAGVPNQAFESFPVSIIK